jgi:hypothetical protein
MSPDTAEMAIAQAPPARASAWRSWAGLRADPARMAAVRETWRALWISRLLILVAGAGTVATLGFGPLRGAFDPPGVTRGFGWLGNVLAAPVARWDSAWYLVIAHYGYHPELGAYTSARDAFFPLYPLGLRALSDLGLQPILAGVLFSLAAFALALYGIHRLSTLELAGARWAESTGQEETCRARLIARVGRAGGEGEVARLAVLVMALSPMAFYFSAVYSESLYLALSVGLFWCARQGRWAWVGVLGALATATRSTGIVLLVPALMLYLYGPREDRPPDFARSRGGLRGARPGRSGSVPGLGLGVRSAPAGVAAARGLAAHLIPRYRPRTNILWLALVPAGMLVYMAYLGLHGGDPMAPLSAENVWGRHFVGPYVAVWDGAVAAFDGARQLLSGQSAHVYFPIAAGSPAIVAGHNLMLLAFLLAAVPLLVIALRALPLAYGVYTIAALALPLSYPVAPQPLMSLPRFELVLFPLGMALAVWLVAHPRLRAPVLVSSALLMGFFVAQFATWHWVA